MSLARLLNRSATIYRRTGLVLDSAMLSASDAGDRSPADAYVVEVELQLSGAGAAGSVTVSGTSSGSPASQSLTFGSAGRQTTTKFFDAGTAVSFTTSGFTGTWTISARALHRDGSPIAIRYALLTGCPMRLKRARGSWELPRDGSAQKERAKMFVDYGAPWSPREGDEAVDESSGERWRVEAVPIHDAFSAPHHLELVVARAEQ